MTATSRLRLNGQHRRAGGMPSGSSAANSDRLLPAASKRDYITDSFLCVCVQSAGRAQAYGGLFMPLQYVTVTSRASGRYAIQKEYGCAAQGCQQASQGWCSAFCRSAPVSTIAVFLILRLSLSFCLLVAAHPLLSSGR